MKNIFNISWISEYTEFRIEIDEGSGYIIVADNLIAKTYSHTTDAISITVKVTAYIDSVLTPSTAMTETYTIPDSPANLAIVGDVYDTVTISWDTVTDADSYRIAIRHITGEMMGRIVTSLTETFTVEELIGAGGAWPCFWVYVYAITDKTEGLPAKLLIEGNIPVKITNLVIQERNIASVMLSWDSNANAVGYKIYQGETAGFDPATEGTLVYDGTNAWTMIDNLDMETYYDYHFKVAAYTQYQQDRTTLLFSDVLSVVPIDGDMIFCKTFDDADVSGTAKIIKFQDFLENNYYFKAYPTISASVNGTADDIGQDLKGIDDADISGAPKIAEFKSNDISYYFKIVPTISAEVESSAGITLNPICINEVESLSGTPRVARVQLNSVHYYFKIYPTKV